MGRILPGLVLVAILPLAGCAQPTCWDEGFSEVGWTEPGLYDRMPTSSSHPDIQIVHRPPSGRPFVNATLDESYGPGRYALHSVVWLPSPVSPVPEAWEMPPVLDHRGRLVATWTSGVSNDDVRGLVTSLAQNVTDGDVAAVEAFARSWDQNVTRLGYEAEVGSLEGPPARLQVFRSEADLHDAFDPALAWQRFAPNRTADDMIAGGWHAELGLEAVSAEKGLLDAWTPGAALSPDAAAWTRRSLGGWSVQVSVDDRASLRSWEDIDEARAHTLVMQARDALGLGPGPTGEFHDFHHRRCMDLA